MGERQEPLSGFLAIAAERVRHHHNALWEEEKHYTWWISVVLGAVLLIYTSAPLGPVAKVIGIAFGSVFGIALATIGFFVVRREGEYFWEALQSYNRALIALGLDQPLNGRGFSLVPSYAIRDFALVKREANKPYRQLVKWPWKLGIRDLFQVTYLGAAVFFVVFGAVSATTVLLERTQTSSSSSRIELTGPPTATPDGQ